MIFLYCSVQHISFLSFKCTEVLVRQQTFLLSPWLCIPEAGKMGYCPMNWDLPHDTCRSNVQLVQLYTSGNSFQRINSISLQNAVRQNLLMTSDFIFNVWHAVLSTF